jgi:D-amino-acid dehydrogenase
MNQNSVQPNTTSFNAGKGEALVIGGGIIGLSSAYYLQQSGWQVTVMDKADMQNNCSYGNAGYICPSHFVPLATPGIVKQGLKWMWNSKSPFYVQPRLNWALIQWGIQFMRSATKEHVAHSAEPLRDIALLSMACYEDWKKLPAYNFFYEHKGLLEIFQTEEKAHHAVETLAKAKELGLDTVMISKEELESMEPGVRMNALGALLFKCDAHCNPNELMKNLITDLESKGVRIIKNSTVTGFEKKGQLVTKVLADGAEYALDKLVVATGSWSRELAAKLDINIPLMPGRGYSITLPDKQYQLNYPAVLMESRLAVTPMNGKIRFGGTMEITSTETPPRRNRVEGIIEGAKRFYPDLDMPMPEMENVWYGYRPCSADGLPYIGKIQKYNNVTVATGHSMLGLSLGAGTGKLVSELVNEEKPSMNIAPFAVERFQ